jgi:DNA-binding transcriptional LysR family regulator
MQYTLHQLQIFLKICELQSITKASEALHLSQPAVSIQMKNFQDQFDIQLTEVIGRKLYITDFGKEIGKAAEAIMTEVQAINSKVLAYKGNLSGRLKIAVVSTGKYVMPYFLSDFLKQHQDIELVMDVTNKTKVLESLTNNEVDLALISILPQKLALESIDLIENRLHLVGNSSFSIPKNETGELMLNDLPWIFRENGSATRQYMEEFFEKKGISAVKKMELTTNEAVKQAILAGLGFSIMPLIGLKNELKNKELRMFPMEGLPITSTWRLVKLRGKKNTPVVEAYLEFLQANKAAIAKRYFNWLN